MKRVGDDGDSGQSPGESTVTEKMYVVRDPIVVARARRRKRKQKINKAEKIREVAKNLIAQGKPPRPVDIVDILAADRIRVLSSQVTMALRGTGMELRPPRPRRQATPERLPDPMTASGQVSLDDLLLVRDFIKKIGTLDKALAAVIAYRRLGMEGIKQDGTE